MELELQGKTAVVTGGSLGIGFASAAALAREGARVVLIARRQEPLDRAKEQIEAAGGTALTIAKDLSRPDAAEECRQMVAKAWGGVDILVNNAGYYAYGNFLELTEADWAQGFDLKFFGYIRMTRAFWPMLKAASGSVVHIIGINARIGTAGFMISGAIGSALVNVTKSMAIVGTRDGVRVNGIAPGIIATDRFPVRVALEAKQKGISEARAVERIMQESRVRRAGEPGEVGDAVCFLASQRSAYVHGTVLDLDGGFNSAI
jgi:3-oxoacyl-[acyl-carrier protein] reductase